MTNCHALHTHWFYVHSTNMMQGGLVNWEITDVRFVDVSLSFYTKKYFYKPQIPWLQSSLNYSKRWELDLHLQIEIFPKF